jgi:putative tryptophan/tyrosine transport system substrate-binding protein
MSTHMRRRDVLTGFAGAAVPVLLGSLAARAQQPRRIGVLMNGVATDEPYRSHMAAFVEQLRKLNWIDGQNIHIEYRSNGSDAELARTYAGELVTLGLDVIVAASTSNLIALQRLSPAAPIVFVQVSDPVKQGFVLSFNHPGGNITGFTSYEFSIGGKWLDLLKQMAPATTHVALMFNPHTAPQSKFFMDSLEAAAPSAGVRAAAVPVQSPDELESVIANVARQPNGGIIFPTDSFINVHRRTIIEAAARYRIPAIYTNEVARDGGLMYYVTQYVEQFRQAGVYVDRILKGTKAGDLPVQTPTRFKLGINLKTARALGIEVPVGLLLIADEQIE